MEKEDEIKREEAEEATPTPEEPTEAQETVAEEAPMEAEETSEVAETPTATPEEAGEPLEGNVPEEAEETEKMLTQSQVNELIGKARAEGREKGYQQAKAELLGRYGVDSDDELDGLFTDGSRYGELSARYTDAGSQLKEAQTELALVKSGVLPDRMSDVKAILSASGLDVTEDNIASLLPTHPEWKAQSIPDPTQGQTPAPAPIPQPAIGGEAQPQAKATQPKRLGVEPTTEKEQPKSDREDAMKLFGI